MPSGSKHALQQASPTTCTKSESFEKALIEPTVPVGKEEAPPSRERSLVAHTLSGPAEYMAGTLVEMNSDDTEHMRKRPSRTVPKFSSEKRSELAHILANLGVVSKAGVQSIVWFHLTKCTRTLQLQMGKAVEPILEDTL